MPAEEGTSFLQWATLVIAAIALAQPWLVALWRRYLRPGRVEIFETGRIEITYGPFGPGIALLGTILGHDREMFVRTMAAKVERLRDGAQHDFEWVIFRPFLVTAGSGNVQYEMPAGFMLMPASPQRYNVFFADRAVGERMLAVLDPLRDVWLERYKERGFDLAIETPGGTPPDEYMRLLDEAIREAQVEFRREDEFETAVGDIDRLCYWDTGDYAVTLSVQTPDRIFTKRWQFSLTEADERGLRGNADKVVQSALLWENVPRLNESISKYQQG